MTNFEPFANSCGGVGGLSWLVSRRQSESDWEREREREREREEMEMRLYYEETRLQWVG